MRRVDDSELHPRAARQWSPAEFIVKIASPPLTSAALILRRLEIKLLEPGVRRAGPRRAPDSLNVWSKRGECLQGLKAMGAVP